MAMFFTSDQHIGHVTVATVHRGFNTVEEHDAALAYNWDKTVKDDYDLVYVLGDTSNGGAQSQRNALDWFSRRPGRKRLISGNHDGCWPGHRDADKWMPAYLEVFESVQPFARRRLTFDPGCPSVDILLSHFPYAGVGGDHTPVNRYRQYRLPDCGEILIHGHTHLSTQVVHGYQIHVGVDAHALRLVPLSVIEDAVRDMVEGNAA